MIAVLLLLTACVSIGTYSPFREVLRASPDHALLYVYNYCTEGGVVGSGANISVDNQRKAYLAQGTYFGMSLEPGSHQLKWSGADVPTLTLPIDAEPGGTYYIKVTAPDIISGNVQFGVLQSGVLEHRLQLVNMDLGNYETRLCKVGKESYFSTKDFR
ncbi:hypothetical protein [Lysobacter sp. A289]